MTSYVSILLALFLAFPAVAQNRHALVVGIDGYLNVAPLQKARNDAQAVEQALRAAGFNVSIGIDLDRRSFNRVISEFVADLQPGDDAVFFFAGHGVEVNGRNFLLAADIPQMRQGDEDFLISEGLAVDRILDMVRAREVRVAVLVLDACRDNPFPVQGTRSLGGLRGLAQTSAPVGSFVLYSAGVGQGALDRLSDADPNPNSVFTRSFLPLIAEPGLPIHEAVRRLRSEVIQLAATVRHDQVPSYYDEIVGEFSFTPRVQTDSATLSLQAVEVRPLVAQLPSPSAAVRTRAEIIRATQVALASLGCDAGPADGIPGRRTREALRLYDMLRQVGFGDSDIGSEALLASLEAEGERVCSSGWIADRAPMALSGDWRFRMSCPNGTGAEGALLLVVDPQSIVRGLMTNTNGQTRQLSGRIQNRIFSGRIPGPSASSSDLMFDLPASNFYTRFEGRDSFGCIQEFWR